MALFNILSTISVPGAITLFGLFVIVKSLYRLTLHPLARFPGPKRAAVSSLYGALWDLPLRTSYVKEFTKWHDKYNSAIVRIAPNELHVRDFDGYNEIFKMGSMYSRDPSFYQFAFGDGSFWANTSVKEGLSHRSLYHPYFSRAAVNELEPTIQSQLCSMLVAIDAMRKRRVPIDMTLAFRCFSADALGGYMFDRSFGFLESPNFQSSTLVQVEELVSMMPVSWYGGKSFNKLVKLLAKLPRGWLGKNGVSATLDINDVCARRVQDLCKQSIDKMTPSIFHGALNPAVEKGQPKIQLDQMISDAVIFFTAGSETTANMLSYCIYHLHQQPDYLKRLRAELATVIPSPDTLSTTAPSPPTFPASWTVLEKLPLLRAAIKETLRISYGVPGRLPRVVPPGGAFIAGRQVPEGTVVSSCSYAYYDDSKLYPEPLEFRPGRWIYNEDAEGAARFEGNGGVDPEKYFTSFSRGSRNCIGINLAYAELYLAIAYVLRNFELELFEMKPGDMDWHDSFIAMPFGHLKVKVVGLMD